MNDDKDDDGDYNNSKIVILSDMHGSTTVYGKTVNSVTIKVALGNSTLWTENPR